MKANLKLHYYTHEGAKLQIVPVEGKPMDMRHEGNGLWSRMTAKVGVAMSTLTDTSHSRLASLVIEQSTAGMNEAIRLLREFENTDASEAALALARDVIAFEEKNIALFKRHL